MKPEIQKALELAVELSKKSLAELEAAYKLTDNPKIKKVIKKIIIYKADRI